MRRVVASIVFFVVAASLFGQSATPSGPEIRFNKKSHDFGRINESINYAVTRFEFTNVGDAPLVINQVQTSCGCTTSDWTRDTVLPQGTGFVETNYETINRIGNFIKTITVYTNSRKTPFVHLDIKGDVYREKYDANNNPVIDYGKLYFSIPTLNFTPLYDNALDSQEVRLINGTVFTTNFNEIEALPSYLRIVGMPKSLEPNESAVVRVIIDGSKISKYGFAATEIPISSDNSVMPFFGIYISYNRKQYFPKMNAKQLAKQPRMSVANKAINFGPQESGKILSSEYLITNTGKKELVIYELYPECTCVKLRYDKNRLQPGESMKVYVVFDTVTKYGASNQSIWVVSNDPLEPERYLTVSATLPSLNRECPTCPK